MFDWLGQKIIAPIKGLFVEENASTSGSQTPGLFSGETLADKIDEIEEILLRADVGLATTLKLTDALRAQQHQFTHVDQVMAFLKKAFSDMLVFEEHDPVIEREQCDRKHLLPNGNKKHPLHVILVVGVNGAGKTTFIGKMAHRYQEAGSRVLIGAGDTFRAAAEEQLERWSERAGATLITLPTRDPAAVVFEALKQAKLQEADVLLLDTAGRLQNKSNLMAELQKIRKMIDQGLPENGTVEVLLVVDATTGQNALQQASLFKEAVGLSGVVLTKLDGSAKGGIVFTIAQEHQLPVKWVGVGEGLSDLKPFDPQAFIDALFERS